MYVEANEKVEKIFEKLDELTDIGRLKFLIYVFNMLNNNQINNLDETNPDLIEDDNLEVFNLDVIGLSPNVCTILLQYFVMLYNGMTDSKDAYEDNGNILGIDYNKVDTQIISQFEKLEFNEKLDVISEIMIKYDNETYFVEKYMTLNLDSKSNGFDLAKIIQNYKIIS